MASDGLTGTEIRMARAGLRWTTAELAQRSGVGVSTIKRAEASDGVPGITGANRTAIQRALEEGGADFPAAADAFRHAVRLWS